MPYLPSEGAPVFYFDAAALRRAGLLRLLFGAKSLEEADYRAFVEATGFDYREDLDSLLATAGEENTYILATGRFDWAKLSRYAESSGGRRLGSLCVVKSASRPDRYISFARLRTGVMAIAVSKNSVGVQSLFEKRGKAWDAPREPVWLWLPASRLQASPDLPPGVSAYLSALQGARLASLALGGTVVDFEVRLRAVCADETAARAAAARLTETTQTVIKLLARENQKPDPSGLSGILAAGAFHTQGAVVHGAWPLPRAFVSSLLE
jgi:hypothetical protein